MVTTAKHSCPSAAITRFPCQDAHSGLTHTHVTTHAPAMGEHPRRASFQGPSSGHRQRTAGLRGPFPSPWPIFIPATPRRTASPPHPKHTLSPNTNFLAAVLG